VWLQNIDSRDLACKIFEWNTLQRNQGKKQILCGDDSQKTKAEKQKAALSAASSMELTNSIIAVWMK
jgi:hypothetical protein